MSKIIRPIKPPTSDDAWYRIVHSLMCHRQGNEPKSTCERAIESLVKKLQEKRDELDSLITAILTNGSHPTGCVTIPRTLDGRLQIAGRKVFPHVLYARIWRWPDLRRNEMRHLKFCKFPFDLMCDSVCVNPYHYERILSQGIGISRLSLRFSTGRPDNRHVKDDHSGRECRARISPVVGVNVDNQLNRTIKHHLPPKKSASINSHQQQPQKNSLPTSSTNFLPQMTHSQVHPLNPANECNNNQILSSNQDQSAEEFCQTTPVPTTDIDALLASLEGDATKNSPASSVCSYHENTIRLPASYWHSAHDGNNDVVDNSVESLLSSQPAPEYWCSVEYFELDTQVGETFKVKSECPRVIVDGYVDLCGGNRFCLGALSNIHRTEQSERARLYIGRGVVFDLHGEGDVWLTCQSDQSIFVQSYYLDSVAGRAPGDAVHKIFPSANVKVFDLRQCFKQMRSKADTALAAATAQAAAVAGHSTHGVPVIKVFNAAAGIGVDDLRQFCIIRLSFVKGWGPDYPRQSIKETPCWIEVHLHRALQLLDEVLQTMPTDRPRPV